MKHRKLKIIVSKYFSILKVLLTLANFDTIWAIEKTIFNKITNKVLKKTHCKNHKNLFNTIVVYLSLICYLRESAYL